MINADAVTIEHGAVTDLYPVSYDYLFSGAVMVAVGLVVAALFRLMRTPHDTVTTALSLALILVVPLLGPAAYLYLTRRQGRGEPQTSG